MDDGDHHIKESPRKGGREGHAEFIANEWGDSGSGLDISTKEKRGKEKRLKVTCRRTNVDPKPQ